MTMGRESKRSTTARLLPDIQKNASERNALEKELKRISKSKHISSSSALDARGNISVLISSAKRIVHQTHHGHVFYYREGLHRAEIANKYALKIAKKLRRQYVEKVSDPLFNPAYFKKMAAKTHKILHIGQSSLHLSIPVDDPLQAYQQAKTMLSNSIKPIEKIQKEEKIHLDLKIDLNQPQNVAIFAIALIAKFVNQFIHRHTENQKEISILLVNVILPSIEQLFLSQQKLVSDDAVKREQLIHELKEFQQGYRPLCKLIDRQIRQRHIRGFDNVMERIFQLDNVLNKSISQEHPKELRIDKAQCHPEHAYVNLSS